MALEKVLSPGALFVREPQAAYKADRRNKAENRGNPAGISPEAARISSEAAGISSGDAGKNPEVSEGASGTSGNSCGTAPGGALWDCYGAAGRAVWPRQGEYTLEDYYALPDEKRVELIDGVFYDMSSPRTDHQLIAGQIHAMLLNHITSKGGNCIPFIAPCDVNLDRDDRTMVQPDVMVICDRQSIQTRIISGAPDLAIEVISPSTRKKDMILKLHKYSHAGVREYWIVDPITERVIVYPFEEEDFIRIYGFDDKIPVGIFGGDCMIDFNNIKNYIAFLKEARDVAEDKDAPFPNA
ncbi:MAG: Uma2 family endonuclease [Stomatobaculum sp.]|nr:Uma2 family endonuclease [Stomatobaculum sp.]